MNIFDKYKNRNRKDKSVFLLIFIVVFTIIIWILVINNLFNPLLAMILMILMIVIVRLDMKNKEKEEKEKMKWVLLIQSLIPNHVIMAAALESTRIFQRRYILKVFLVRRIIFIVASGSSKIKKVKYIIINTKITLIHTIK